MPAELTSEHFVSGSPLQIEWAHEIRRKVDAEFTRVAVAFRAVATGQSAVDRASTQAVIAILEEKRAEVLAKDSAGYFIRDWQELSDQVRRMIAQDPRYQAIQAAKARPQEKL
jgi:hypothetical protein